MAGAVVTQSPRLVPMYRQILVFPLHYVNYQLKFVDFQLLFFRNFSHWGSVAGDP